MSTTDTNQASELFELCKEVYKRFPDWNTGQWIDYHEGKFTIYTVSDNRYGDYVCPLYTSDYLLEKLPATLNDDEGDTYGLTVHIVGGDWLANYAFDNVGMWHRYGTTPLKALLELTIALSEAGELNG
jgi:hypothetical protein